MTRSGASSSQLVSDVWWSAFAPVYEPVVGLVGWHRWQDALVADIRSGRLLDVACGPAHLARRLVRRGVDYVGVDRNRRMLDRARFSLVGCRPGRARLVRAELLALPFPDHSFDVVVSTGALGLLTLGDRRRALAEIVRVSTGQIRLLEPVRRPEQHVGPLRWRTLAFVRDRPLDLAELNDCGLSADVVGPPVFGGVYSFVRASVIAAS